MIKTEEFLDIKEIERIRNDIIGKGLDPFDNLSWHIVLKDNDKILGIARLYKYSDGIMIDKPCLYKYTENYYELLLRTLLLKAVTIKEENIYIIQDKHNLQYGFKPYSNNLMKAEYKDIKFPEKCGGCKNCE